MLTIEPFSAEFSSAIPGPSPDRPPMRVNAYDFAQMANSSLANPFPYLHRGAIVPGITLFNGGPDAEYGHFFHENTEEEVALVMGGQGTVKPTGTIMIAPLLHGVQAFLKDPKDPNNFLLIVITQRQSDERAQKEMVFWRCGCNEVLFEHEFDSTPEDSYDIRENGILRTTRHSSEAAEMFNADVDKRTCKRCGKIADPFPVDAWGWTQQSVAHKNTSRARALLLARGSEAPE